MKVVKSQEEVWFSSFRVGESRIRVQSGCIFNYNGKGLFPSPSYFGAVSPSILPYPVAGYPGDDIGTHVFVEPKEFDIHSNTKLWLKYELYSYDTISKMSIVDAGGESLHGQYENSGYGILKVRDYYLNKGSPEYICSPTDYQAFADESNKYILIADISSPTDSSPLQISQKHEGVFISNRFQQIINTAGASYS